MDLPAKDREYLSSREFDWELLNDGAGNVGVLIKNFDVSGGGFSPANTNLMIRLPASYNMTPLDMWYCDPPIRNAVTGAYAQASEVVEAHFGRQWQRFSRHLDPAGWRPGLDGLRTFMALVQRELQSKAS